MRTVLAWVVAIAACFGAQFAVSVLEGFAGLPITFSVHGADAVITERSAGLTAFGLGANILCILAAIAAWHFVKQRTMSAGGRATFIGFLLACAVMIVIGVPLWKAFEHAQGQAAIFGKLLELALAGVACFAGVRLARRLKTANVGV